MQRKPGFPVANCSIKMPDCAVMPDPLLYEEDSDQQQRRQQLINFGHSQWGFNNWSWSVSKQELDFVDFTNGKYCAGVVAFVSITVKSFDIHRENIGYATSTANSKGFAIYKSRKCAVTNALRETLLSFGGSVASELSELLDVTRDARDAPANAPDLAPENNQNLANRHEHSAPLERPRKEPSPHPALRSPHAPQPAPPPVQNGPLAPPPVQNGPLAPPPAVKNAPRVLGAMPANRPPAPAPVRAAPGPAAPPCAAPPPAHPRPNSNVSFVLQPVVGALGGYGVPPLYGAGRVAAPGAPHVFPAPYYEYGGGGGWHFAYESYERPAGNVNLNFNVPPKNLLLNGRGACRPPDDGTFAPPPPTQGCWIKPTIFYDGFWTEQKVKKWVAEQVEKQFPEDASAASASPDRPHADKA